MDDRMKNVDEAYRGKLLVMFGYLELSGAMVIKILEMCSGVFTGVASQVC